MYINSDTYTPQEIYIHAQKHTHILKYTHTHVTANRVPPQFYNQSISLHTHICIHTHMYKCIYIHAYTDAHHTHIYVYPQPFICACEHIRTIYAYTLTVYRSIQQILLKKLR